MLLQLFNQSQMPLTAGVIQLIEVIAIVPKAITPTKDYLIFPLLCES